MTPTVLPFRIEIDDDVVADLRGRLQRTRWPDAETVDDWSQGVPLRFTQELCAYWRDGYDFAAAQERLNSYPNFRVEVGGLNIHFVHARSPHPDALPLLITHGWPGSVAEFRNVIGPLTDPAAHGGDPADAFHVVCPSLPGYGFSDKPDHQGWGVDRIAATWAELMSTLGYGRYGAQGGDWGARVTDYLARRDEEHLVGIHLTSPVAMMKDPVTEAEENALATLASFERSETGYSKQQGTRPQTLAYGLTDSPAEQCAWIIEKFRAWTDCDGDPWSIFTRDELLDNVMLYWLPAAGGSSARLYWESFLDKNLDPVRVPTGCSIFPKEIRRLSRRWAEQRFTNIQYWKEMPRGGHFAALEQPDLFVAEMRAFFRLVRG